MVYLSMMTMFKDEAMNMKVWLEHYQWQGVEAFYMIDNGSTDDSVAKIQEYQKEHPEVKLYIFDLPEKHAQVKNYNLIFRQENLREKTKWLIVCDLDEFFYCPSGTIRSNLPKYEKHKIILSHWKMFGSSGLINHPSDIRISLTKRVQDLHTFTKYIVQTKYVIDDTIHVHEILSIKDGIFNGDELFPLNHYPIQSEEFFRKVKMTRGDSHQSVNDNVRDMNYFRNYDEGTDVVDEELKNLVASITSSSENFTNENRLVSPMKWILLLLLVVFLIYLYMHRNKLYRFYKSKNMYKSWIRL